MKRKIAVVTGSRAEYGILKPLLEMIRESPKLELKILVTGMHLVEEHGLTIKEIRNDGFDIDAKINMYNTKLSKEFHALSLARGIAGFAKLLSHIRPDILLVLGDRLEILSAVIAAGTLHIPIAHIHGGDKTDSGHIDEIIRDIVSRFAHIHFTATKMHTQRLIKRGEQKFRIKKVGALGLDSVFSEELISKERLFQKLVIDPRKQTVICIFHPVQPEWKTMGVQMHEILKSLVKLSIQTVVIYPNNDVGSKDIISEIKHYENTKNFRVFRSLPHREYINLLRYADVMIGNSSSGFIESPSLGLRVINVGTRNRGREQAGNVVYSRPNSKTISKILREKLKESKKNGPKRFNNPYGNGKTSEKIVKIINEIKLDKKFCTKIMVF